MSLRTVILAMALTSAAATLFTNNTEHQQYMWNQFKAEYRKDYTGTEDATRFVTFVKNLALIDQRNAKEAASGRPDHAVHGITKFADLSPSEFASRYLRTDVSTKSVTPARPAPASAIPTVEAGASSDWAGVYTTPVKDQGYCGSCWAFSVSEQVEADANRLLGYTGVLSPQELVSCDTSDAGCNGGWPTNAYDWIESEGGLCTETDYPYSSGAGETGTCSLDSSTLVMSVSDYAQISAESDMGSYVAATGPLAIAVDASEWSSYTGGVLTSCGTSVDHAVQAVGVDTSSDGYWKVRNSWGSSWGESGYIRLSYGVDLCAITTIATYVTPVAV